MESEILVQKVCDSLVNHKAEDVVSIALTEGGVADYFVIASGRNTTHVSALAERLEEEMEKEDVVKIRAEGLKDGRWAVIDYGDVIVHIFNGESRLFYHLEKLWDNGENVKKY